MSEVPGRNAREEGRKWKEGSCVIVLCRLSAWNNGWVLCVFAPWPVSAAACLSVVAGSSAHPGLAGRGAYTSITQEVFDQFPNGIPHDRFQNFDGYVQFDPAQAFPGPPTPPGLHPVHAAVHQQPARAAEIPPVTKTEADDQARTRRQGSNSEEDELTPAQSRRKAQNRAAYVKDDRRLRVARPPGHVAPGRASRHLPRLSDILPANLLSCSQRAFRERKERHVKDLENRLQQLEQAQQEALSENERLKRDLQKMSTENEILRATSMVVAHSGGSPGVAGGAPTTTGPMTYSPADFYSNVLQNHTIKTPSHRIVTSENGERLLAAGATWEFIINHDLFKRGLVDVAKVSERLRPLAKCDGQGPVFEERDIIEAIQESAAGSGDELI